MREGEAKEKDEKKDKRQEEEEEKKGELFENESDELHKGSVLKATKLVS